MIPNSLGGRFTAAVITDGLLGRSVPARFGCALFGGFLCIAILVGPRFWLHQSDSLGIGQFFTSVSRVATASIVGCIVMIALGAGVLRGERLWALVAMLLMSGVTILKVLA